MAKTSLQIQSTLQTTGKKITTNISNINNNATSANIRQLATKLNDLTTNQYYQADAVKKYNVDTEEVPTELPDGQLSLTLSTYDVNALINGGAITIGKLSVDNSYNIVTRRHVGLHLLPENNTIAAAFSGSGGDIYLISTSSFTELPSSIRLFIDWTGIVGQSTTPTYKPKQLEVVIYSNE